MVRERLSTPRVMWVVNVSLIPGIIVGSYWWGPRLAISCLIAVISCALMDALCSRKPLSIVDGSAVVTGLLIGLSLPPTTPFYLTTLASILAIGLAKALFGGLGQNLFNPAMLGYACILVAFPQQATHYDAITGATALDVLSHRGGTTIMEISQSPAFGSLGAVGFEWQNVTFLVSGIALVLLRIVPWYLPAGMLFGIALPTFILFDAGSSSSMGSPIFHLFAGGTMLAAFYVVTDPVTAPRNILAKVIFAIGVGVVTVLIRSYGSWPDGIAFAILLGNALAPLLDKLPSRARLAAR